MAAGDQEMLQGHVRPESGGQMHIGRLSGLRCSRVDHDELGPVGARKPIQNSHPEHGLLRRDVVANMHDGIRHIEVAV